MKIVMISMWYCEHSILLANELSKSEEVHVFIDDNETFRSLKHLLLKEVSLHEINKPRGSILNRDEYFSALMFEIKLLNPSVLLIQDGSVFLFRHLKKLKTVHKVVEIHDPIPHEGEKKLMKCLNAFVMARLCNEVVVHSKIDVDTFKRIYRVGDEKVWYSPLGIYSLYKQKKCVAISNIIDYPYVLFFGRITKYKGLEFLLRASKRINRERTDLRIVIAGTGNYLEQFREEIKNCPNIVLIDRYIENELVDALFENCLAVVMPYISATQSGVLFTALDYKKPCVASNVGGIPEIVNDTKCGILVDAGNSDDLADAIIQICDDNQTYVQQIDSAGYTYEVVAEKMLNHYKDKLTK